LTVMLMFPLAPVAADAPLIAKDEVPVTVTFNAPDCDGWVVTLPE
jgi:hypothetical protein